jgi:8-oxo-dGTP diphosphatase
MKTIRVTAAIMAQDGCVLIAQRPPGGALAGKWEFPGGKIEPGETPQACLQRELREELGIAADIHDLFAVHTHTYDDRRIELAAYTASIRAGVITLHEHSDARWVAIEHLRRFDLCAADLPFVEQLQAGHFSS